MLDLLAAWLLYPAVALIACAGIGLLVERAAGRELPGALIMPVGMAALIGATQLTTYLDATAELTVPLVIVLALAGVLLSRERLRSLRPDGWLAGALLGAFAVYAAPTVLTGEATFQGYTVLGDTANHFLGADAMLEYGRDFDSLPPSTYEFALEGYFGINAYPAGGPTAAGALTRLAFQDVAWTFQPFLSLLAILMGSSLWALITPHVPSPRVRAAIVFAATQPAIVLAYALQGSVKEVGTAYAVAVFGALVPVYAAQAGESARRSIPLAVAAGAAVAIVGPAAAVWLAPLALAALAAALWGRWRQAWRPVAGAVAVFLALSAVLSYQMLLTLTTYVEVSGGVVTAQQEVGNLLGPLDPLQTFGVWLVGDYRNEPHGTVWDINLLLLGVVVGAIALAAIWAARTRAWAPAAFVLVSILAYVYVTRRGSPWADGKAIMIVAPALVLAAGLGAASLGRAGRWLLLGAIALGVLWSNAYQYHDSSPAPRDRLEELAEIGERIAGQGPTVYTEFEEFAKHFLRHAAPEGTSEGYQRRYGEAADRTGQHVPLGFTTDLDRFTDAYVQGFRTIVLRRGFEGSRPGSLYELTYRGRYYEVWQRPHRPQRRLLEHHPLGDLYQPSAQVDCRDARRLARRAAAAGGRLVLAERSATSLFVPAQQTALPPGWFVDPSEGVSLYIRGPGRIEGTVDVPEDGVYDVWAEASTIRPLEIRIDGRALPQVDWQLNGRGTSDRVGSVRLSAGTHRIEVLRRGGRPWPGDGGYRRLSPIALVRSGSDGVRLVELDPEDWRRACGRTVDWIEAVA